MELVPFHISALQYRVFTYEPDGEWGVTIVVLAFIGKYRYGSAGNPDAHFMKAITECALLVTGADGVLFDEREFDYEFGNGIWNVYPDDTPYVVVVSENWGKDAWGRISHTGPTSFDDFDLALQALLVRCRNLPKDD